MVYEAATRHAEGRWALALRTTLRRGLRNTESGLIVASALTGVLVGGLVVGLHELVRLFHHTLFGRTLERQNLLTGVAAVATVSDDYDDRIVAKYGGQRALDRIRDTGGRKRRREKRKG